MPTVVCNEFVFVAGQMASSGEDGLDPRAHVPGHSAWGGTEIRKPIEFLIFEKLKAALETAGSSLDRSVKAQAYLQRVEDFPTSSMSGTRIIGTSPVPDGSPDQVVWHGGWR